MLKLLSLNTKLLPSFARWSSLTVEAQAHDIADWLLAQRCHVICLQEVFAGAELLRQRLAGHYRHIEMPQRILFEDDGLFIASRFPFVTPLVHHMWRDAEHPHERASSKGFTYTTLDLSDTAAPMSLGLVNLHMHSDYAPDDFARVRSRQVEQLRATLLQSPSIDADGAALGLVALGDFNICAEGADNAERPEYTSLRARLDAPRDLFRDYDPTNPGATCDDRRIDFALSCHALGDLAFAPLRATHGVVLEAPHSDHRALVVEVAPDPEHPARGVR